MSVPSLQGVSQIQKSLFRVQGHTLMLNLHSMIISTQGNLCTLFHIKIFGPFFGRDRMCFSLWNSPLFWQSLQLYKTVHLHAAT